MKNLYAIMSGILVVISLLLIRPVHAADGLSEPEIGNDPLSAESIERQPIVSRVTVENGLRNLRPVSQVQIFTLTYPFGIGSGQTKLVPYSLEERGNISGEITSRTFQFFTQYDEPLSDVMGPYKTNIPVKSLEKTDWDELVYLPESVADKARSIDEYAIVLKTTFNGKSTSGAVFNAQTSLLLLLPPEPFSKDSLTNRLINQSNNPSLYWNSSVGAIDYDYCIDTSNNNHCDANWNGTYWLGTYGTDAALHNLPSGKTFYWQVRANNQAGTTYANDGVWWSFTMLCTNNLVTVQNTNDLGPGSLRQAIADVCSGGTINFASSLSGEMITLSSTLIIDKDLTIDGSALNSRIRISGNNTVGVIKAKSINGVTLDSLLITDGNYLWGGGIENLGVLTLVNCVISNNSSDYNGGGITNFGKLTLIHTAISENTATTDGGGIYNDYYVGSVSNQSGKLTITDSVIADNKADYGGGVLTSAHTEVVTIINSTFSGNSAMFGTGGGIASGSTLEVLNSIFSKNTAEGDGGGIANGSELTIINSTFSENSVGSENPIDGWGGAIFNSDAGVINVTNSTFVKNSAGSGGAIFNYRNPFYTSTLTIINSTFSENSAVKGGGVYNMGTLNITNSILANSVTGNDCYHDEFNGGTINTNVNNLIETNAPTPHDCGIPISTADPKLGPLANNGGFTQTMALLLGSPAINAGTNIGCPATDQRGVKRPQSGICDIGAYEHRLDATFTDVPTDYWAWIYIEGLYSAGVTSGCNASPLMFCPTTTVTRDQVAVFLLKAKHGSSYMPPTPTGVFSDVPTNYWAAAWIEQLAAEGITAGCGGGNYCPTTPVTRDQMTVFLLKAKHGSSFVPPTPTGVFSDVPTNYWAAAWIEQLAAEGVTAGCGGGNYCPTTPVTRDQMAVFLVRSFNLPAVP